MKTTHFKSLAQFLIAVILFGLIGCTDKENKNDSSAEPADKQATITPEVVSGSDKLNSVAAVLVNASGEKVDAEKISKAPYLLFYYSAHWCPPCRLFTPKLVEFYNANGGGETFDIIFVSSDRSEKAMFDYMKEEQMPWAAVAYGSIADTGIKEFGGPYIPSLMMYDDKGKLVLGTDYDAGVEPDAILEKLKASL